MIALPFSPPTPLPLTRKRQEERDREAEELAAGESSTGVAPIVALDADGNPLPDLDAAAHSALPGDAEDAAAALAAAGRAPPPPAAAQTPRPPGVEAMMNSEEIKLDV